MLAVLIAIFVPLEFVLPVRRGRVFTRVNLVNFFWYFLNALLVAMIMTPVALLIEEGLRAVLPWKLTHLGSFLPLWPRMAAAMVVGEIGFYWGHRWSHEWPWLWRFHAVHHSAEELNFLVNTRAHPIDAVFTRLCGFVLLYATGLTSAAGQHPALIPALVLLVGSGWSFLIHSNVRVRLGPFEEILTSPAFHHWHHTYEDHKDRNFSAMVPFIDRVFGTFYLPKHWPDRYGTATKVPTDLVGQFYAPFALRKSAQDAARDVVSSDQASKLAN